MGVHCKAAITTTKHRNRAWLYICQTACLYIYSNSSENDYIFQLYQLKEWTETKPSPAIAAFMQSYFFTNKRPEKVIIKKLMLPFLSQQLFILGYLYCSYSVQYCFFKWTNVTSSINWKKETRRRRCEVLINLCSSFSEPSCQR